MSRKLSHILWSGLLLGLLTLGLASPARAFDGRDGDKEIVIAADEVIEDDLYLSAEKITVNGTIKGDLVAAGQTIIVNGVVEGDANLAGQSVLLTGKINDDARIAAAALLVDSYARIGDDLVVALGSLETRDGSQIGGDLVMGGGQGLIAGEVAGNAWVGTSAFELKGQIAGDLWLGLGEVEDEGQEPFFPPMMFGRDAPFSLPGVRSGFVVDKDARIGGKLDYYYAKALTLPENVVAGGITRHEPPQETVESRPQELTPLEMALENSLNGVRNMAVYILVGLILTWLFPSLIIKAVQNIKTSPLPALGWGIFSWPIFIFSLLAGVVIMILAITLFGALTLDSLLVWSVLLSLLFLVVISLGFVLALTLLTPIIVSTLAGKLVFGLFSPNLAEHKIWPLVLGSVLFAILTAIPYAGPVVFMLVMPFGLGALWMMILETFRKTKPAE